MGQYHQNDLKDKTFEDEIDLKELFSVLWNKRLIIIALSAFFSVSSIFYSLSLSDYYNSESILMARDSQDAGPLSQFSEVSSLAGINFSSGTGSSVFKVLEIIKSRVFVKHLLTFDDNILPSILAPKGFNFSTGEIVFDPEIYDVDSKKWVREVEGTKSVIPTYLEAHRAYLEMLSVSRNDETGFIFISMEHLSPVFAKEFLILILNEVNKVNKDQDIESSRKAIEYLKSELTQTSQVEIKKSINKLIEAQLEMKMTASIYDDYSLITIEPPFVPEKKSKPSRALIVIFTSLIGGILTLIGVLLHHYFIAKEE